MKKVCLKIFILFSLAISVIIIIPVNTYAESESVLIFSHRFHVAEQEFECSSCHIDIESSSKAVDDNLPTMDECGSCHDVEDDETCGLCHLIADEPEAIERTEREILFNHQFHLDNNVDCMTCHSGIDNSPAAGRHFLPSMKICLDCHNGQKADNSCAKCHSGNITLSDIHPLDWRHQHGDKASSDMNYCLDCHSQNQFCLSCHFGDNTNRQIHELNFQFTHGLDAQSKNADCAKCHSRQMFCVSCHESGNRMPLAHSTTGWINLHGQAAKDDVENCASCHNSGDPTCAESGCHNDFDGILGTNPKIHTNDLSLFDSEQGPWHNNDDYYCYQCHISTEIGFFRVGFCGYCHTLKE